MKKLIKQLFCCHKYKFDRIDVYHPTKTEYKIAHKTCLYCGKEKTILIHKTK